MRNVSKANIVCLPIMMTIGLGVGYALADKINLRANEGYSSLCKAVSLAERRVDQDYGSRTFINGMRRILKDGNLEYYTFQVKADIDGGETNMLVNVDMRKEDAIIDVDFKAASGFVGAFSF